MQRIGHLVSRRHRDEFADGDHQEYVEAGTRDIALIAGAALLLIGGFILSLL